jgi:lysophospholipase L1-like esterase
MTIHHRGRLPSRNACVLFAALSCAAATAQPLVLHAKQQPPAVTVAVATSTSQRVLEGATAAIDKPASEGGHVDAARAGEVLTLRWKDSWYSALRFETGGTDLRPYVARGVVALDLKVSELAKGGLTFKIGCGDNCERKVPYVLPARAMQGKGWQRLSIPVSCFVREGDDFSAVKRPFEIDVGGSGELGVRNIRFAARGKPNVGCADYKTASVTPDMLNESWAIDWWLPRHLKKLDEIRALKAAGKHADVVFIGDSITQGWEKEGQKVWDANYAQYNALALGFGGDRTENVLWRLQHGEVDGISPKVAVLMFGTNNTGHRMENAALTAAGIRRNIDELRRRLPDTKILLLAIFPRGQKADDPMRLLNERINAIIAGFADGRHVFFQDINQAMLDADGTLSKEIMPDLLHPNEKGYEIWARSMKPQLQSLLNSP